MQDLPISTWSLLRRLAAPLLAILLLMLGNGFFLSFVSMRLNSLNFSDSIIGLTHSAYYLGMLIGAARAEVIIYRVGHIRAYLAYAGIGTACLMLQGLILDPTLWIIIRLITGFCLAMYYIVVESWLLNSATVATRGAVLAIYMIALYSAQAASQFILNVVEISSAEPFLVAGLLCALSGVPLALTKVNSPTFGDASEQSIKSLFKSSYFGFLGCFISGIILSSIYSFAPIFAQEQQISVAGLMSSCIFGGVCLQWPLGKLSDIVDRRLVLFGVTVMTASLAAFLTVMPLSGPAWYAWMFLLGGLCFTLYPLAITQVCDRLQPEDITKATGVLLLVYGLGAVLGPVAAPACLQFFPMYGLFVFILVNALALALVGFRSILFRASVPEDLQGDFVALPRFSPVAYELDPRSDVEEEEA